MENLTLKTLLKTIATDLIIISLIVGTFIVIDFIIVSLDKILNSTKVYVLVILSDFCLFLTFCLIVLLDTQVKMMISYFKHKRGASKRKKKKVKVV